VYNVQVKINILHVCKYDELNRIQAVTLPDETLQYAYNNVGDITDMSNNSSTIHLDYDLRSQLTLEKTMGLNQTADYPIIELSMTYDLQGNRQSISSTYGGINYGVDNLNRLTSMQSFSGQNFSFGYDLTNRLTQVARPGSLTNFNFSGSQLASIVHSSSNITKSFFEYSYDSRGLPTQKRGIAGNIDYGYDQNGQLTSSTQASQTAETFAYDSLGNRTQSTDGASIYDITGQRLTEDWQYNYSYDNNGNMILKNPKDISKKAYQFEYSSTNQLKRINILNNPYGQVIKRISYFYDARGRRMQKQVEDLVDTAKSSKRKFVYDGDNIMLEFDQNNQNLAKYTHSPLAADDVLSAEITTAGVTAGLANVAATFFYLKDHLGTVTDITNIAGQVLQRMQYSAFGGVRTITDAAGNDIASTPALKTSFTFTGREKEDEVPGLYYYRARYYDSNIGRFLQEDPDPGKLNIPITTTNKFVYTGNRPNQRTDAFGQSWVSDFVGYIGVGLAGMLQIVWGIVTLDPARIGAGLAMNLEFYLGPLNLLINGKLPKYTFFEDSPAIENSLISEVLKVEGFSVGAAMFLTTEKKLPQGESLIDVKRHEYGHYLQYKDWGGWTFADRGWREKKDCSLEFDADERADRIFDNYKPAYPNCRSGRK
jgi:RHS repeat-associated protein